MDLRPLPLQKPREVGSQSRALAVIGNDPGRRAFGPGLGDRAPGLEGEIAQELIAIVRDVLERKQERALAC